VHGRCCGLECERGLRRCRSTLPKHFDIPGCFLGLDFLLRLEFVLTLWSSGSGLYIDPDHRVRLVFKRRIGLALGVKASLVQPPSWNT
jgi:hypothetical protein